MVVVTGQETLNRMKEQALFYFTCPRLSDREYLIRLDPHPILRCSYACVVVILKLFWLVLVKVWSCSFALMSLL